MPEVVSDVWQMLDRDHLASFVRRGPEAVFATVSGAHLYGFASHDSDVDLRGAFLHAASALLGLNPPAETITLEDRGNIDLDWVAHDLRKFVKLLTQHNGYVLEQLYSPLVVVTTPLHIELLELGKGCITRRTARHYEGFARAQRLRLNQPDPTVKHLLYAFRVLLTGIYLMETGEVEANIQRLNEKFRLGVVDELVDRKRAGSETMALESGELLLHSRTLNELSERLQSAYEGSSLPLEPTNVAELDAFVVRARLGAPK